jgi:hypothetical protein
LGVKIKEDELDRAYSMHGRGEVHTEFWPKHEEKRPLERPRYGWEDNIEVGVKELGWKYVH